MREALVLVGGAQKVTELQVGAPDARTKASMTVGAIGVGATLHPQALTKFAEAALANLAAVAVRVRGAAFVTAEGLYDRPAISLYAEAGPVGERLAVVVAPTRESRSGPRSEAVDEAPFQTAADVEAESLRVDTRIDKGV